MDSLDEKYSLVGKLLGWFKDVDDGSSKRAYEL